MEIATKERDSRRKGRIEVATIRLTVYGHTFDGRMPYLNQPSTVRPIASANSQQKRTVDLTAVIRWTAKVQRVDI
jgi:hypothetical protein